MHKRNYSSFSNNENRNYEKDKGEPRKRIKRLKKFFYIIRLQRKKDEHKLNRKIENSKNVNEIQSDKRNMNQKRKRKDIKIYRNIERKLDKKWNNLNKRKSLRFQKNFQKQTKKYKRLFDLRKRSFYTEKKQNTLSDKIEKKQFEEFKKYQNIKNQKFKKRLKKIIRGRK